MKTNQISQREARSLRTWRRKFLSFLRRSWSNEVPEGAVWITDLQVNDYFKGYFHGLKQHGDGVIIAKPVNDTVELYYLTYEGLKK